VSERDVKLVPPPGEARGRRAGSPRITATMNVSVASEDRRSRATPRSGAIGGLPPFEPPAGAKAHRSPGELGPAADRSRGKPRAVRPRRAVADAGEAAERRASGSPESRGADSPRRETLVALPAAPAAGFAGLPGLGVPLGELGSPAKADAAAAGTPSAPGLTLGRMLRAVPSLIDVSVSIGGDPARGRVITRLAAPLRALAARRSDRDAASGRVAPPPATSLPTVPGIHASRPTQSSAPRALDADPALAPGIAARPSRLRRASRYIVNGILDVAIRRFGGGSAGQPDRGRR
jgi:hypothetical protein